MYMQRWYGPLYDIRRGGIRKVVFVFEKASKRFSKLNFAVKICHSKFFIFGIALIRLKGT